MQPSTRARQEERSPDGSGAERPPQCPICAGRLIPLRDTYRCARCHFSVCLACEGAEEATPGGG